MTKKLTLPSGTAIKTAEMILGNRSGGGTSSQDQDFVEKVKGVRGGNFGGVQIHSVRLPTDLLPIKKLFSAWRDRLSPSAMIPFSCDSFMPGVLLGIRRVGEIKGVMYGLEGLLFAD